MNYAFLTLLLVVCTSLKFTLLALGEVFILTQRALPKTLRGKAYIA